MRMSCNGCRVLRKGCSDDCSIRPCLQWIKSPESQANATLFLAKFYGRAGLINLINAGPDHLRPAIFRSLLYEACGRIVNPIYGSIGLLWSGSWQLTQAAVEAVLKGAPISQIPSETVASAPAPPLKAYDIRHVSKVCGAAELHKVNKPHSRFKRSGAAKPTRPATPLPDFQRARSHDSAGSHASEAAGAAAEDRDSLREEEEEEGESMSSADTAEEAASHVSQGEPDRAEEEEVGLELTLGFEPISGPGGAVRAAARALCDLSGWNDDARVADLGLALPGAS